MIVTRVQMATDEMKNVHLIAGKIYGYEGKTSSARIADTGQSHVLILGSSGP